MSNRPTRDREARRLRFQLRACEFTYRNKTKDGTAFDRATTLYTDAVKAAEGYVRATQRRYLSQQTEPNRLAATEADSILATWAGRRDEWLRLNPPRAEPAPSQIAARIMSTPSAPPAKDDRKVAKRRRWLAIIAFALCGYGIWKIGYQKHNVDVSGYHFSCGTAWQARGDSNPPFFLSVIDVEHATQLTSDQIQAEAVTVCHRTSSDAIGGNLFWIVPVGLFGVGMAYGWYRADQRTSDS